MLQARSKGSKRPRRSTGTNSLRPRVRRRISFFFFFSSHSSDEALDPLGGVRFRPELLFPLSEVCHNLRDRTGEGKAKEMGGERGREGRGGVRYTGTTHD